VGILLKKKQNDKKKRLIALILTGLFALGCGYFYLQHVKPSDTQTIVIGSDVQDGVYKKNKTKKELEEELQKEADGNSFALELNTEWNFKDSKTPGLIGIVNPKSNKHLMQVAVYTKEEKKLLYDSGYLKPEQYIEYGKLTNELSAGNHQAVARVKIYDESGQRMLSENSVNVNIYVES
jgi:hypothetical protein